MALINIEYGSLASSEVVNNNFQYLDDKIFSVSQTLNTDVASLSESITTLSSTVDANLEAANTADETLQNNIDDVVAEIEEVYSTFGKSYIVETYISGTSYYRVFSDGWCEQGGVGAGGTGNKTVYLIKTYKSSTYDIMWMPISYNGTYGSNVSIVRSQATDNFVLNSGSNFSTGFYWRTAGYIS